MHLLPSALSALRASQPHRTRHTLGARWDATVAKALPPGARGLSRQREQQARELGSDTKRLSRALSWAPLSHPHSSRVSVSPEPLFSPLDDLFALRDAAHFHEQGAELTRHRDEVRDAPLHPAWT